MAGEVSLNCTLSKNYVPVTQEPQKLYALVDVQVAGESVTGRMPINLNLVLDHSGSMSGKKIADLREAVKFVIDQLEPNDIISVTIFNDSVDVILPSQAVTDKANLKSLINSIDADDGTTISLGMRAGLDEIAKNLAPDKVNRVLLLTDGQTHGDEDKCEELAKESGTKGVPINALGLGDDWNAELLSQIANHSGGSSTFLKDPGVITGVFQGEVRWLQAIAAQNSEVTFRLTKDVTMERVHRTIPDIAQLGLAAPDDRTVSVRIGEISKDHGQRLLFELMVPPRQAGQYRIAQVEISYDLPMAGLMNEKVRTDILLNYSSDPSLTRQVNAAVLNIAERIAAWRMAQKPENLSADQLQRVGTVLLSAGDSELGTKVLEMAKTVRLGQQLSEEDKKTIRFETGKTVRLDKQT
ncbi:VWA domain-containing protein [Candidatus Poribacteria bacterium]|nr:VWA domain-containing protein [Candidatus Poribacteria bacterium]